MIVTEIESDLETWLCFQTCVLAVASRDHLYEATSRDAGLRETVQQA